jgi:hypothetical protein
MKSDSVRCGDARRSDLGLCLGAVTRVSQQRRPGLINGFELFPNIPSKSHDLRRLVYSVTQIVWNQPSTERGKLRGKGNRFDTEQTLEEESRLLAMVMPKSKRVVGWSRS